MRVLGTAAPGASVSLGSSVSLVAKRDRAYGADLLPGNASPNAAAGGSVTVNAALPGTTDLLGSVTHKWTVGPQTATLTYDPDGNLTSDGVWTYVYDAENRLIQMTSVSISGYLQKTLWFKYDYLNRRVEKRVLDGVAGTDVTRRYLYDGWALLAELDTSSTPAIQRSYTWGLDLAGSLDATGGVGALLRVTTHSGGTTSSYFPAYDGNGNVIALVNLGNGGISAAYEYGPFGEVLRAQGGAVDTNPFRFSTKFTDTESGLVYYGARYYSPSMGRFLNRDPIAEKGGRNLYGFCGNNAVNGVDFLGFDTEFKQPWTAYTSDGKVIGNYIATAVLSGDSGGKLIYSSTGAPASWSYLMKIALVIPGTVAFITTTGTVWRSQPTKQTPKTSPSPTGPEVPTSPEGPANQGNHVIPTTVTLTTSSPVYDADVENIIESDRIPFYNSPGLTIREYQNMWRHVLSFVYPNVVARRLFNHYIDGAGGAIHLTESEMGRLGAEINLVDSPEIRDAIYRVHLGLGGHSGIAVPFFHITPAGAHANGTLGHFTVIGAGMIRMSSLSHSSGWYFMGAMSFMDRWDFDRRDRNRSAEGRVTVARNLLPGESFDIQSETVPVQQWEGDAEATWSGSGDVPRAESENTFWSKINPWPF